MDKQPKPWQLLARRVVYDNRWVRLLSDTVRLPDGSVVDDYHVVDIPQPAVFVVPVGDDGRILLTEQYRYIHDLQSWEIPGGRVDANEPLEDAAARELREETGFVAGRLEHLGVYHPASGRSTHAFHVCVGHELRRVGEVTTPNEVLRVAWFTPDELRAMIVANEIRDGSTLTGLLWYFFSDWRL